MNKSIIEGITANGIFGILSLGLGIVLHAWGVSLQLSSIVALLALLTPIIVFFRLRKVFQNRMRWLTGRLLDKALQIQENEDDKGKIMFKQKIIEKVLQENPIIKHEPDGSTFIEYPNQLVCEEYIKKEAEKARIIRILTIRGEKYFVGTRSLLHDTCLEKIENGNYIEVLVLSPESTHITDKLAEDLKHSSAERIREDLKHALLALGRLATKNPNIQVKYYNETPNFKILIFDNAMFVSSFAAKVPKNDKNAKMYYLTRDGNLLFAGFERYFEELSKRSVFP